MAHPGGRYLPGVLHVAKRKKVRLEHAGVVQLFAQQLRRLRLEKGLTQPQLAAASGLSNSYVGRLELCESAPQIDTVERLASALGCRLGDLLPDEGTPDDRPILREQIQKRIDAIILSDDRHLLATTAQILAAIWK
jgi:transcriptional regulator with XRE-family HTH domain